MRSITVSILTALALTACGKKGPLVYPEMLVPAAPSNVYTHQSGTSVNIAFDLPTKDLAGRNVIGIAAVTIVRKDDPSDQKQVCTSCLSDYSRFRSFNLEPLPSGIYRNGNSLLLQDSTVVAGRIYSYRISTATKENLEGALSPATVTAVAEAPVPPVARLVSQPTELLLEFNSVPPSTGEISGYNVYRAGKGDEFPLAPVTSVPVTGGRFVDSGLERATVYRYAVRSVIKLPAGTMIESGMSNEVEGQLKDDE